jgi:hypothetical protein
MNWILVAFFVGCFILGVLFGLFIGCAMALSGRISEDERRAAYWHEIRLDELE